MRKLLKFSNGGLTSDPTKNIMQTSPTSGESSNDMFGKGIKGAMTMNKLIDAAVPAIAEYQTGAGNRTGYQKGLAGAKMGFDIATGIIGNLGPIGAGTAAILKGADWLTGKLAKRPEGINIGQTLGSSSGYGGLKSSIESQSSDIDAMKSSGGITRGLAQLFGGKTRAEMNRETQEFKRKQMETANILKGSKKRLDEMGTGAQYKGAKGQLELSGMTGGEMVTGKQGMKLIDKTGLSKESLKNIISNKPISKFEKGGKINVIVDGKLHGQNHDLKEVVNVDITSKGVPVVSMEEGGEITEQTAEVEKNELILHLELTKKLEELKEKGDDEAMIEAGKILSNEIVKNTRDSKDKILKNS